MVLTIVLHFDMRKRSVGEQDVVVRVEVNGPAKGKHIAFQVAFFPIDCKSQVCSMLCQGVGRSDASSCELPTETWLFQMHAMDSQ
jgi:hypothetical protein